MRARQRQAAARQFVAQRHRLPTKCAEDAVFKPGEIVYRKGQACTVVLVGYDTVPPHIVVRTSDGNEVGTEPSHLERLPPPSPRRPLALAGARAGKAAIRQVQSPAPAAPAPGDNETVASSSPAVNERHAALTRMRNRRAERAAEAARVRDDVLADLLADERDSCPATHTPRPQPPLPRVTQPSPRHERMRNEQSAEENFVEVSDVLTSDASAPTAVLTSDLAVDTSVQAAGAAGDASPIEETKSLVLDPSGAAAIDGTPSSSMDEASLSNESAEAILDGSLSSQFLRRESNSGVAADLAAMVTLRATEDFCMNNLSVMPPVPGDLSDIEFGSAEKLLVLPEEQLEMNKMSTTPAQAAEAEQLQAEADRLKAEHEARQQAADEARLQAELEAKLKAEDEARLQAAKAERLHAEEAAQFNAQEEAGQQADEEARLQAELEAKQTAEEEARLQAAEAERLQAEEAARFKAEEEARQQADEEARLQAELEAKQKVEEEATSPLLVCGVVEPTELAAFFQRADQVQDQARLPADECLVPQPQHSCNDRLGTVSENEHQRDESHNGEEQSGSDEQPDSAAGIEYINPFDWQRGRQAVLKAMAADLWSFRDLREDDDDVDNLLECKRPGLSSLLLSTKDDQPNSEVDEDAPDELGTAEIPSMPDDAGRDLLADRPTSGCLSPVPEAGVEQTLNTPVDVLLCLDASFAMHAPLVLTQRAVANWNEDDWDFFGKHLRSRAAPCCLEPLGLAALDLIATALKGLSVEVHLCGEEDRSPWRYSVLDSEDVGRRWKRILLRGPNLWGRVAEDLVRLQGCDLQNVVVLTGAEDDLSGREKAAEVYQTVGQIALAGVPVHVIRFGASQVAPVSSSIAAATGGSHTIVNFDECSGRDTGSINAEIAAVLRSLRSLPRLHPTRLVPSEAELHAAASMIQHAERARQRRARRRVLVERKAVAHIEAAYASWRLRRSIEAAAHEGKRARKRAPVEEALRRRRATKFKVDAEAAARRIQSEWRSRRIRLWCQRVDRAARRIQSWCRRRWLRQRLERQAVVEAKALQIQRRRMKEAPPPPPSQWQQLGVAPPNTLGSWPVEPLSAYQAPQNVQAMNTAESVQGNASYGIVPKGNSALLACPPPMKKPPKPRNNSHASQYADGNGILLPAAGCGSTSNLATPPVCCAPIGAPPLYKRPGLRIGSAFAGRAMAVTAPVGPMAATVGNLPRSAGSVSMLPRLQPPAGVMFSPRTRSSPVQSSRRTLDTML